jgi:hemolysin activation/secretion protein
LGDTLAALGGHGTAQVANLWAKEPLLRRVDVDLYAQVQFDHKVLRDDIEVSDIHTHRHLNNWTASLAGDERDALLSSGLTTWSLSVTGGRLGFDDAKAELADAATADTRGRFLQGNATVGRLERLSAKDSLYLSLSWQWADANLDPSQKMVAGGAYTVRAFDMSALTGDSGVQYSIEWRHDLTVWQGQWQAVAFLDSEHLKINKSIWSPGPNAATLTGGGVGLNWIGPHQWSAKASIASRLGSTPVLLGETTQVRVWVQVAKGF